ncbi:hypothetical protein E4U41_002458 [Claviceps citrina]|nr:hypothetical protein E4U41_002458 [Claviceps citrina]
MASTRPHAQQPHSRAPASAASSGRRDDDGRRGALPLSMMRPLRPNPSTTSVAPSTAEGKAIPVDDATAEHRTLALREINSHYPSRHRYASSTGAQSTTYSEPVVVRTYYSPAPSRHDPSSRRPSSGRGGARSIAGGPWIGAARRCLAFAGQSSPSRAGSSSMLSAMAWACTGTMPAAAHVQHDARLPPMEAFSFKSFMAANVEAQAGAGDINSDLDRIAEICARSHYSLSNQYEVHYAPHASGAAFLAPPGRHRETRGPTWQAVASENTQNLHSTARRRRRGGRRNSRAMGTLETIMSSSRSSDEGSAKKTSASALAAGVRGRGMMQTSSRPSSPASSSRSGQGVSSSHSQDGEQRPPPSRARRPSTSLALMDKDNARQSSTCRDTSAPRAPSLALVSEPALPQTFDGQLETRTAPERRPVKPKAPDFHRARGSTSSMHQGVGGKSILSAIFRWLPWRSTSVVQPKPRGRAERSLRHLLHNTGQQQGKGTGGSVVH